MLWYSGDKAVLELDVTVLSGERRWPLFDAFGAELCQCGLADLTYCLKSVSCKFVA